MFITLIKKRRLVGAGQITGKSPVVHPDTLPINKIKITYLVDTISIFAV